MYALSVRHRTHGPSGTFSLHILSHTGANQMTYHSKRTAEDERISDAVIDAVSAATDTDPLDLPLAYEEVDLDAVDSLFHRDDRSRHSDGRIEFRFAGCDVRVYADGRVAVSTSPEPEFRTPVSG